MMTLTRSLTYIAIVSVFVLFGCGFNKSPSDVVNVTYMAANSGQYSEVEKHLSKEALSAMKGTLGAFGGGFKGIWDQQARNGTIEKIEVKKEDVRGEGATVLFTVYYKDGSKRDDTAVLIKE